MKLEFVQKRLLKDPPLGLGTKASLISYSYNPFAAQASANV